MMKTFRMVADTPDGPVAIDVVLRGETPRRRGERDPPVVGHCLGSYAVALPSLSLPLRVELVPLQRTHVGQ
jgi:hypothetical protein